ncbi:MAG: hypothetical protein WBF75_09120 [Pseudonocardiaceae bacterium]
MVIIVQPPVHLTGQRDVLAGMADEYPNHHLRQPAVGSGSVSGNPAQAALTLSRDMYLTVQERIGGTLRIR